MDTTAIDEALARAGIEIPPLIGDDEFTLAHFAKMKGVSKEIARNVIERAVSAGVFDVVGLRRLPHVGTGARMAYRIHKNER